LTRSVVWFLLCLVVPLMAACPPAARSELADLERGFADPPDEYKPRVYWWWLYNRVDKEGITRDLEQFRAKGIGGVNLICTGGYAGLEPLPGLEFLGPQWRECFRHMIKEAQRLDIEVGFNLAGGWVMMGPWVTPEGAMKKIVQSEVKVTGPKAFSDTLPQPDVVNGYYHDVWVQAFPDRTIDPGEVFDLTDRLQADGRLEWEVPEGDWVILRTGYTLTGSRWNAYPDGDTFKGGEGYQIDYLSKAALDDHFHHLGDLVIEEAAKAGGKLDYLWSDSWECGKLTWTLSFPDQFRKYRGYDLKPYMPALSGHIVIDADVTTRFLADVNRTIQDCIADNFYGHFAKLCHEHGMAMRNEAAGPGDLAMMDSLENLGRCDVPAGEFWVDGHYRFPGGYNLNLKQTASAAHIYGKKRAAAEAFTQQEGQKTHWYYGPGDLKPFGEGAFCEGINAFMLHQATCQPPSDGKPGYEFCAGQHWTPNITWWDQSASYFSYLSRCQYLLQQGVFVGDVCFYLGEEPPIIAPPKYNNPALGFGYDCDYSNAEVLLTRMSVKEGRVVLPDGMSYRLLVLQNCASTVPEIANQIGGILNLNVSPTPSTAMSVEVTKKIRDLVRDGATVVGAKPDRAAGLKGYPQCDDEVRRIAAEVWGDCDGKTVTEHRFGKGRVIWGRTPREILEASGLGPDFDYDRRSDPAEAPRLDYIHRATGDADIYFVANRTADEVAMDCTFRVSGKQPEIWDPVTGEMRDAIAFAQTDNRTSLPLEFAPYQSLFVVFRKSIAVAPPTALPPDARNFPKLTPVQEINGVWTVQFDTQWGGPASVEFPDLISWTKRTEVGIKYYSGKATYRKTFDLVDGGAGPGAADSKRMFLDLGDVKHVAQVRLNGRDLGVLWTAPWRVDITDAVKPSGNLLEVDVTNLWANRVIGDLGLPEDQRIAKTHAAFRFDMITKDTPLLESGLLGPVVLLSADEPSGVDAVR
jgi:hypothetical protein